MAQIVALDLGSTRFKAGLWTGDGFSRIEAVPAPPLQGEDPVRECDADSVLEAAHGVLDRVVPEDAAPVRLGLTCQRSSFLVWDAASGNPVTPVLSWQDRRAAEWCTRHAALAPEIVRRTGLLLSPHYLAPKLAYLRESDAGLADGLETGRYLVGTLDTYLFWRWSSGKVFLTDPTIAARTLLIDLAQPGWDPGLMKHFGVPRNVLGEIRPSYGVETRIDDRYTLVALVSDQASGVIAALGEREDAALVNLGTGGFVLVPVGDRPHPRPGYLCGPYLAGPTNTRYALEGTMNGIAPAVDKLGDGPSPWPSTLLPDRAFCIPDSSGLGSPYWLPRQGLLYSAEAGVLPAETRRLVVLEGIVFRVCQIAADLCSARGVSTIYLSGGLSREPLIQAGLAALLPARVLMLEESESTLRGVALLAAGLVSSAPPDARELAKQADASYFERKYVAWCDWMESVVGPAPGTP